MLRRVATTLALLLLTCPLFAQSSRHFIFRYEFTIHSVEQGKPLRVWIPLARSGDFQTVRVIEQKSDLPLKETRDQHGNAMLYGETAHADHGDYTFAVDYDVVRRERIALTDDERNAAEDVSSYVGSGHANVKYAALTEYLKSDRLVPTSGVPAQLASQTVAGRTGDMAKARALYDYVLKNMRYDKSGTGWGRGDSLWACDSKRGNCTDFHSLFISMARSQGIPARFEIGFPIPRDKSSGEVAGYHCWAEFYSQAKGWVPVDISEAWKDPNRRSYFFGAWDDNRVQFTAGRDLELNPRQAGEPLNYFIYPYVEMGGKKYENIANHFSFEDAGTKEASAASHK